MTPSNPPPAVAPRYVPGLHRIDKEVFKPFVGCYICVWLRNRRMYWFCPSGLNGFYMEGYVWRQVKWHRARLDIRLIADFY